MNPKQFLQIGGAVLLLVAILGFFGIIGPTPEDSIFGESWYFTTPENWAHLILGVVALIASVALKDAKAQMILVMAVGVLALAFGVINLFLSGDEMPNFYSANLENPADTILHFAVGIWAIASAMMGKKKGVMGMGSDNMMKS